MFPLGKEHACLRWDKRRERWYRRWRDEAGNPHGTFNSRWLWEQAHGPIPEDYHIHHINGDKTDDRLENLQLVIAGEHKKNHDIHRINWSGTFRMGRAGEEKFCQACQRWLPLPDFGRQAGKRCCPRCKECDRMRSRVRYAANHEKELQRCRDYYAANSEEILQRQRNRRAMRSNLVSSRK